MSIPSSPSPHSCPCGTGKTYEDCCKRYHDGLSPETALLLMRSRYSAYAKQRADYIILTTHPKNRNYSTNKEEWKNKVSSYCKQTTFDSLEILEFKDGPLIAYVTFIAKLHQGNRNLSFKEKSRFEKVNDRWLYLKGDIFPIF